MATFNSFAALERQIMKDMQTAAQRSKDKIEMELIMNVNGYYGGSTPQRYQRTGTLLTSPDSTPVQGSGKHLEFSVYMDEGISYSTGTFSGAQVIDATERGGAGTMVIMDIFKEQKKLLNRSWTVNLTIYKGVNYVGT